MCLVIVFVSCNKHNMKMTRIVPVLEIVIRRASNTAVTVYISRYVKKVLRFDKSHMEEITFLN